MMLYSRPEAALTAVLLAAGLLPMNANAYVSFSKNGEELIHTLHTHIYSPTLSLPSSKEIKVAKVCFITDVSDCSGNEFSSSEDLDNPNGGGIPDYDLNDAERCRNEGYTLSGCPDGFKPSGKCPYGDYYAKCVETCPSGYKTCEPPYYGVGEMCGGKYASCEEDTERACKELNPDYTNACESGWQIHPNDKCKYDETFGTCCNQCIGYDYTTIPEGYIQDGDACTDCNGQTKYKVKINPCDGFMDCGSMGPAVGANSCLSGTVTKYDNCKPCPNLGTLTSCPSPYTCTYEECSNRYYKSGCQSGYDWNASSQICTAQCESSYKYTCSGTGYSGGSGTACGGKYKSCQCASGYEWSGTSCKKIENACMKGSQLGYILNSDMTVTASQESGKTPIGVVVCSYAGGGGQAIALKSIGLYKWSTKLTDISELQNYASYGDAAQDYKSCKNSNIIRAQGNSSAYPAVWAAYEYSTEGTEKGDWCLPAAGIFYSASTRDVSRPSSLVTGALPKDEYWSSTEKRNLYAYTNDYMSIFDDHFNLSYRPKDDTYEIGRFSVGGVQPVIGFCGGTWRTLVYVQSEDACVPPADIGRCNGYAAYCSLGDILFSDGTCSSRMSSKKTPIGVVAYKSGKCGYALALESIGSYQWTNLDDISEKGFRKWGSPQVAASNDIGDDIYFPSIEEFPAAQAAKQYSTEGVDEWMLPGAKIINSYYNNQAVINAGFTRAGGTPFTNNTHVWTASLKDSNYVFGSSFDISYGLNSFGKNESLEVRPVIEF